MSFESTNNRNENVCQNCNIELKMLVLDLFIGITLRVYYDYYSIAFHHLCLFYKRAFLSLIYKVFYYQFKHFYYNFFV